MVALYPLSSPNHNNEIVENNVSLLRYILFHHQTTTENPGIHHLLCCVISSFITKPQLKRGEIYHTNVALYPLSSPNHNPSIRRYSLPVVALYPLSSPNHNWVMSI